MRMSRLNSKDMGWQVRRPFGNIGANVWLLFPSIDMSLGIPNGETKGIERARLWWGDL